MRASTVLNRVLALEGVRVVSVGVVEDRRADVVVEVALRGSSP